MFCNLISIRERQGCEVTFPYLDQTMPELGASNLLRPWQFDVIPRVVKTHREYWSLFRNNESILLLRDPRDVMDSYYDYKRRDRVDRFRGEFSEFIRDDNFGIPAWAYHFDSWVDHAEHVVLYEDMKEDDIRVFVALIGNMGLDVDREAVKEAVRRSRFDNVQSAEEAVKKEEDYFQFDEETSFARKGKTGDWREKFSDEDLDFYHRVLRQYNIYDSVPDEYVG